MKKLILSTIQLFIATILLAQAPDMFNFQFVARDASDNLLINQDISVRIGIRSGHSSGTEVFAETHQVTTNAYGMASLTIGSGNVVVGASLSAISWGSNQYFVQISLDPAGGSAFQPYGTTQLLSVPYALYAGESGNSSGWKITGNSGNTSSNFIGNTDNIPLNFRVDNQQSGSITSSGQQFFGYQAGQNNTATSSTAVGFRAMRMNTTGIYNTALGYQALRENTTGNLNTAVGVDAMLFNTTGIDNTAIGYAAMKFNTTGQKNVAAGESALLNNTVGALNAAMGWFSLNANTTGERNTAVGSASLRNNSTGNRNVAVGERSLLLSTIGNFNTAVGNDALSQITTGSNNIGIGYQANVPSATGSNQVRIGNNNISYAGIEVPWTTTSDRRAKQNIKASDLGLDFLMKLNPVVYSRTADLQQKHEYGFIAQEVAQALTDSDAATDGFIRIDDEGKYGLRYNDLLAPMVKAIQQQQQIILRQQELISRLASELEQIKSRLEQTESQH